MVFNLISAAMVYSEFKNSENGTHDIFVTYPEFCLSVTDMGLVVILNVMAIQIMRYSEEWREKLMKKLNLFSVLMVFVHLVYSSFMITFYNNEQQLTREMISFSLAVIILSSISLCYHCVTGICFDDN